MQKYFVEPEQFGDEEVIITGQDAHHLVRVMRSKPGAKFIVSDGEAREALVELVEADSEQVKARILEHRATTAEAACRVTIAQSLPKGDKMELIIQKCTEIGAVSFIPFQSDRTVVQYDSKKEAKRLERWSKIAKEAAEQSHRNRVPDMKPSMSVKQLVQAMEQYDLVLLCYEDERGTQIRDVVQPYATKVASVVDKGEVLIIVGPEGGFTAQEVETFVNAGAVSVGLGRRILRAETAGMLALTCVLYETGEMGGV
ncbi:16S rRNA (uracil(1498)-N(3))-methyltransferase [Paenibacillus agilis]|uniref:Ribosomal RNA small subunit methyltransferase E n=1 Tax=Paenibacillus agilis TaxID=3020863 RepID=A0A559J368_9BACL|nr:16S rRNA (uracil(1498)-N(3))-methyltransferase [Paenibacillus agilis]TVX94313.1 16S rRNA (uracil(1498)-N(3))-methyltransferase [Paenibacillus agilis]